MVMMGTGALFLFVCLLLPVVRTTNPRFFPCDNDTNSISVDCEQRDLTSVPRIRSHSVLFLNLNKNRIQRIGSDTFSGVPNLQNLSLMWNCLPGRLKKLDFPSCRVKIDLDAFIPLRNLSNLQLAGNSLTSIPPLPDKLLVLGLEFNNLFQLEQPLGTPLLRQLLLAKNCYYANPCNQPFFIGQQVFQDLLHLENLTLGFNNMTSVPLYLPHSLVSLDLRENTITEIGKESFAGLPSLRYLNLEWNCQRCDHAAQPCFPCPNNTFLLLDPHAFDSQAGSLTHLSLRGNSLSSLPPGLFTRMGSLRSLDLSDNLLAYAIRNGTFYQELRSITSLNLIYNYEPLKTFPELVLSPFLGEMTALTELKLSGFFFHLLSSQSLEPLAKLPRLEYLDLRMNFINSCNVSAFSQLRALKTVVLAQNMLDFNPSYPSYPQIQFENQVHREDRQDQQTWCHDTIATKSEFLLDTAQEMPVDDGPVCYINTNMWYFRKHLCYRKLLFDLSQNNIPFLNTSTFRGMEEAVCLDLSYNYMSQTLNGQQFHPLRNLAYLNMAHNRIDLYSGKAFVELRRTLRALDLSNNEFHFLMRGMGHRFTFMTNLTSLEALSLANNNIGLRISNVLTSSSLRYLSFSGNRLDIMWDTRGDQYIRFFKGLTNLTHLDISLNQLGHSFSPEALSNLPPSLQVLRVDNNLLNFFPWGNITVLAKLCYLNLSANHLSDLPDSVYFGPSLTGLDLSHNRISALPEAFFRQATTLRTLLLNHNQLKLLEPQALPAPLLNGSALRRLTLHTNPFTCSCATSWFAEYLRASPLDIPYLTTGVRCGFPESQQGVSVLSIDPRSCQEIFGSVAFLCTSFLTIVMTAIPLVKRLYGWDLWYCIQVLWAGQKGYSQLRGSATAHQHDAFVVFDTRNQAVRDWMYNELVPGLETAQGRWRFRLCLEERDWLPGVSCIENLHGAVYNSRKTVFVLTNSGGGEQVSGVVRQAFLLVQQRLLDEKVDVAVLVLLDPLFPKLKYLQMRKRLCRKSVLSWPRNPQAQPLFWNNLCTALATDNAHSYDRDVTESFLSHELR